MFEPKNAISPTGDILVVYNYTCPAKGDIEIVLEKVELAGEYEYWSYLASVHSRIGLRRHQILVSRSMYRQESTADVVVRIVCLSKLKERLENDHVEWPRTLCWPPEGWLMF
jgi:hypothetical protein